MIVIEGFDGAGKTTLAQHVGLHVNWPVVHTGGPTKDVADVNACLHRSFNRFKMNCVQDRTTHISESVYSMLSAPEKSARAINRLHQLKFARIVVYCRPDNVVLANALLNHQNKEHDTVEHMLAVERDANSLIRVYDTVMAVVALHTLVHTYDRTRPGSVAVAIKAIEEAIK